MRDKTISPDVEKIELWPDADERRDRLIKAAAKLGPKPHEATADPKKAAPGRRPKRGGESA